MIASLMATSVIAAETTTVVTPADPQGWSNPPGENSVTGSAVITSTAPRSGNGSLELSGDRSRFILGNQYNPASNLFLLNDVENLSFDYMIDPASSRTDYSPAVRLHVWDGAQRSELIFEQVYNGPFAAAGTWVTTSLDAVFWRFVSGSGVTLDGGSQVNLSISDWTDQYFSDSAYVSAISRGQGSSASAGYKGYADNLRVGFTNGDSSLYNFEATAAVPEPATWALMLLGFGGAGAMLRRRKQVTSLA
ncbi:MAG: PEPxxWA-CTERM sorting domain-containing protein [Patescibacteria group bacterium]